MRKLLSLVVGVLLTLSIVAPAAANNVSGDVVQNLCGNKDAGVQYFATDGPGGADRILCAKDWEPGDQYSSISNDPSLGNWYVDDHDPWDIGTFNNEAEYQRVWVRYGCTFRVTLYEDPYYGSGGWSVTHYYTNNGNGAIFDWQIADGKDGEASSVSTSIICNS